MRSSFLVLLVVSCCYVALGEETPTPEASSIEGVQPEEMNEVAKTPDGDRTIGAVTNFITKPLAAAAAAGAATMATAAAIPGLLIAKPLIAAAMVKPVVTAATAGLAATAAAVASLPKPSMQITVVEHQGPQPVVQPSQPPVIAPPKPNPQPQVPPIVPKPDCGNLEGFACYRLPSGCYCPISTQMTWKNALAFCGDRGRSLISFETQLRQSELNIYLPLIIGNNQIFNNVGFWTSGVYSGVANIYLWASPPIVFTYTNWAPGDPNGMNLPNGACVRSVPTRNFQWDDIGCEQALPFICFK